MLTHRGTQTIETPRLILRKACREDAEPMFRNWASDPDVTKYLTWPTYEKVETAYGILDYWIAEYEKCSFYQWMIVLKELGEPIGSISVVRQNEAVEEAEIHCIGLGIAFVPDYCVETSEENLFFVETEEKLPPRELALVHNEHIPVSKVAQEFLNYFE